MDLPQGSVSQLDAAILRKLREPSQSRWYVKGVQACLEERKAQVSKIREKLEA